MICEKCWADAYSRMLTNPNRSQASHYADIVFERNVTGTACTPKEQAGEWWDEDQQLDTRFDRERTND